MEPKPISPVIVTFKALPGVRVQAMADQLYSHCSRCRIASELACTLDKSPNGDCLDLGYIWREVGQEEQP